VDVIDVLLKNGADVDVCTNQEGGSYSPLKIAMDQHGKDHPLVLYRHSRVSHSKVFRASMNGEPLFELEHHQTKLGIHSKLSYSNKNFAILL
jgi:hypothetical protein